MTRLRQLDNQLSAVQSRVNWLLKDREELEAVLRRKRKPATRESILAKIASIDSQIKAAEKEEWEADDERYDLIWRRR